MSYPHWTFSAVLLFLLGSANVNNADEPQLLPRTGVLVLRHGHVLRGNIVREGDRYIVGLNDRDEVAVPIENVSMHCHSLDDAYQRKRALLPPDAKVADHLELADWCLRYDLTAAAAEQLNMARQRDPLNPANERFATRLRMATQRPVPTTSSSKVVNPIASQTELDEMVRSLPAGSIEQFTNTVQPLLINRCGTSGCHGSNSKSGFKLAYPNWSRSIPRRFTQRNLQSALQHLNQDAPDKSAILEMATTPHGGAKDAALSEDDVTPLAHMADWVFRTLEKKQLVQPTALKEPATLLLQPSRRIDPLQNLIDFPVQPASHTETQPARPKNTVGPPSQKHQAVDPFDPEIFNRRFLK